MSGHKKWINVTPNLQSSIKVINKIPPEKLTQFLNRICQNYIHNPDSNEPFTEKEEQKLLISLSLSYEELKVLEQSSAIILAQAAYHITKPPVFSEILTDELKVGEQQAEAFLSIWTSNAKQLISRLKNKSIFNKQLEDISWLLNIESSSDSIPQTFSPNMTVQLKVKEGDGHSNITLQMDEEQVHKVFNALEDIQLALDKLQPT